MSFPTVEVQNLIQNADFIHVDAQIPDRYAIVEARRGAAYHIRFHNTNYREEYLFLTRSRVKLFCNNEYYGGLLVVYDNGKLSRTLVFCTRAEAFVLADSSAPYITPIGQCADLIWDTDLQNPNGLRNHFEKQYESLLESHPMDWEENFRQLLSTNTTFSIRERFIDF